MVCGHADFRPWARASDMPEIAPQVIAAIDIPILLIISDSDIVTSEHAVAMFRLLGGGVLGDLAPLSAARFAVLPGS
jgi:pimeloyl-ACP methyl ester carboxylesterase